MKIACLLLVLITSVFAIDIMPVSEIRPGMIGYGLSVFRGNTIERFHVEVVDVLKGFLPEADIILVRCTPTYGSYDLNKSGLIAGMSGSPIYIEGKLVGALAYGWEQAKETMAGITPIESMLAVRQRPLANTAKASEKYFASTNGNILPTANHNAPMGMIPIATPVVISGVPWSNYANIQKKAKELGLMIVPGGMPSQGYNNVQLQGQSTSGNSAQEYQLTPGAAVGAQLISGDMDMTAIGTVTWVNGDEVLAFGHPFLGLGTTKINMTTAHIATVLMNNSISFKMGYPVASVGTVYHDRNTCVYGKMNVPCPMIPVEIGISHPEQGQSRDFHVEIMEHPLIGMFLVNMAIENFLVSQEPVLGEHTIKITTTMWLKDRKEPIVLKNQDIGMASIRADFTQYLEAMIKNPFERLALAKLAIHMEISPRIELAKIVSAKALHYEVYAGDTAEIDVLVQPNYKPSEYIHISFPLPKSTPKGWQPLIITTGSNVNLTPFAPRSSEEYIKGIQIGNQYQGKHLVAGMILAHLKVACQDQTLENLPGSIVGNLLANNETMGVQIVPNIQAVGVETSYVLEGVVQIFLNVKEQECKHQDNSTEEE